MKFQFFVNFCFVLHTENSVDFVSVYVYNNFSSLFSYFIWILTVAVSLFAVSLYGIESVSVYVTTYSIHSIVKSINISENCVQNLQLISRIKATTTTKSMKKKLQIHESIEFSLLR